MKKIWLPLVLVIVLAGSAGYYLYSQGKLVLKTTQTASPNPTFLVGNDKDEHGCLGSAGYSWCAEKQKCLRVWEEDCIITQDETSLLKEAMRTQIMAKRGASAGNLTYEVSKVSGDYAQGSAFAEGEGGGMWFAAKVNGSWQLVWDGNGIILCRDLSTYSQFPSSLIPECYDSSTDKLIKR